MTTSPARRAFALALLAAAPLAAQEAPAPIQDNSFLIEEAYNQEAGVVQHISTFSRDPRGGDWGYAFTQEWPLFGQRHQFSYTVPLNHASDFGATGLGDASVHYRYQLVGDGRSKVAVAPRLSALLPTGDDDRGLGSGRAGVQGNLPVSVVLAPRLVAHTNAGLTWLASADGLGDETIVNLGQSAVWLAHPRLNLLLEAVFTGQPGDGEAETFFVSPGVRAAFDVAGAQVVPGVAVPIGVGASEGERSVFLYLSIEHPFSRRR
ncbi:MAG TPA: transporter [Longimicrobium sp.]|nr:transporter [Longimicrobium sp.]